MELLKIDNQVCFPIYTAAKVVDKVYKPLLHKFGINYLQYLTMIILHEFEEISPEKIANRLGESEKQITPLLHDLEKKDFVILHKEGDEIMKVKISEMGEGLRGELSCIPQELMAKSGFSVERLHALQLELVALIRNLLNEEGTKKVEESVL